MSVYEGTIGEREYAHGLAECVLWQGGKYVSGYGARWRDGRSHPAHRLAWLDAGNEIPSGYLVHHDCGNKLCVNVAHLRLMEWGEHSRLHHPRRDVCERCGSDDWKQQKDGRCCRTCANARRKALHEQRKRTDPDYRERERLRVAAWREARR